MADGKCAVCEGPVHERFQATILRKYRVGYLYCERCGLLQTEEPFWLEEAYSSAIAQADTGLVQRNIQTSKVVASTLYFLYGKDVKCVDLAGGFGLLTRLMRDYGFECSWDDKYCENVFARGFEWGRARSKAEMVTAFEVLEHVTEPVKFIRQGMQETGADSILLSTEVFEGEPPRPGAWEYYAFSTGQHISFYQEKTLRTIAEIVGLECHTNNNFHLLTKRRINKWKVRILTGRVGCLLAGYIRARMQSKTLSDHQAMMEV